MKPIIKVENLSKRYRLGTRRMPFNTLRETISGFFHPVLTTEKGEFWALHDLNFTVEPGEVVGIIGRNGAGKSTLLKILAQVTEPTAGRVELFGHINSLLEVGTGFHPELTGRENIYVNGAILGLKKAEIKRLFDEIVDFAEVENFLDTAVKHYSSGMYMRLAFSVAAHLNPDILIIDEVLSVGDVQFQKKCLGKVQDVARTGRTVLFVSHNLAAVENLCSRGIVLEKGRVIFSGEKSAAISQYMASVTKNLGADLENHPDRSGSGEIQITAIEIKDTDGNPLYNVRSGQDIDIFFRFKTLPHYRQRANINVGFMMRTYLDVPVFLQHNRLTGTEWGKLPTAGTFVCRLPRLPLPPADYRFGYSILSGDDYLDRIDDAAELAVVEGDFYGSGEIPTVISRFVFG